MWKQMTDVNQVKMNPKRDPRSVIRTFQVSFLMHNVSEGIRVPYVCLVAILDKVKSL